MSRRWDRILWHVLPVLVFLSLSLGLTQCKSGSPDSGNAATGINIGDIAPEFTLLDLEGKAVSLSDFRGRPVLLNFWASWCGPCRAEMPFLQQIKDDPKWTETGLVILTVNVNESPDVIRDYLKQAGLSLMVVRDENQGTSLLYNVRGIPMTYLIARNGIIKGRVIGAFPDKSEIEKRLSLITGN